MSILGRPTPVNSKAHDMTSASNLSNVWFSVTPLRVSHGHGMLGHHRRR